jgi:hypothetical protein
MIQKERFEKSKLFRGEYGAYVMTRFPGEILLNGVDPIALVFTDKAPLTHPRAGLLAVASDVIVTIDGNPSLIFDIDPLLGIIYVRGHIFAGSSVQVEYTTTPHIITPITGMNDPNYLLNQFKNDYAHPFTYSSVLAPFTPPPQALTRGHRYRAFERAYSSFTNDPTSMVLNEDNNKAFVNEALANFTPQEIGFESASQSPPRDFEHIGPSLGVFLPQGGYRLEDLQRSDDLIGADPNFFRKAVDLPDQYRALVNARLRVDSYTAENDWTGAAFGYADGGRLYFVAFLDISGFRTVALLRYAGDESRATSYRGMSAVVEDRGLGANLLVWHGPPPFLEGTRLLFDHTMIRAADVIIQDPLQPSQFLIELSGPLPMAASYDVMIEQDYSKDQTYRLTLDQNRIALFRSAFPSPLMTLDRDEAAVAPQVYGALVRPQEVFWGALSRRASTVITVSFLRYNYIPLITQDISFREQVRYNADVLPDLAGFTPAVRHGAPSLIGHTLHLQTTGRIDSQGIVYDRDEPFLSDQTAIQVIFRARVQSMIVGQPFTLVCADGVRELTLTILNSYAQDAVIKAEETLLTSGLEFLPPNHIVNAEALFESAQHFAHVLSGVTFPENEAWQSNFTDPFQFEDRAILFDHNGLQTNQISKSANIASNHWVCVHRISVVEGYEVNSSNAFAIPVYWGLEDGTISAFLTFTDNGTKYVAVCDHNGQVVITTGMGRLQFAFDWQTDTFYTVRLLRNAGFLTLSIDGAVLAVIPITDLAASPGSTVMTRLVLLQGHRVLVKTEGFFAHSTDMSVTDRRVGIYRGGHRLLASSYTTASVSPSWFGNFVELKVFRDPKQDIVQVFADDVLILDMPYTMLPEQTSLDQLSVSNRSFVSFGSFDGRSLANVSLDYLRYDIRSSFTRNRTLPRSALNTAHVITSPEPLQDTEASQAVIVSDTKFRVRISQIDRNPIIIISVTSLDGGVMYPFAWSLGNRHIMILGAGLPSDRTPVIVTFLEGPVWTEAYLRSRPANTRLLGDTPIVPLSQQALLVRSTEPSEPLEASPTTDITDLLFNQSRVLTDGVHTITFSIVSPGNYHRPYYTGLEVYTDSCGSDDVPLSPACDHFTQISLDTPYEDTYRIPLQGDPTLPFPFLLTSSLLTDQGFVLMPYAPYPISLTLAWGLDDATLPLDDRWSGALEDFAGSSLLTFVGSTLTTSGAGTTVFTLTTPPLSVVTPLS